MDFQDKNITTIKKIRRTVTCSRCKKRVPKGSWAYGNRYWEKVCITCEKDKVFVSLVKGLSGLLETTRQFQKELNENWVKYNRDNMIAQLQDNG